MMAPSVLKYCKWHIVWGWRNEWMLKKCTIALFQGSNSCLDAQKDSSQNASFSLFPHCSNSSFFFPLHATKLTITGEWLSLLFRVEHNCIFSFLHGRWLYYSVPRTEGPLKEECHCGVIYWMAGYCGWATGCQGTFPPPPTTCTSWSLLTGWLCGSYNTTSPVPFFLGKSFQTTWHIPSPRAASGVHISHDWGYAYVYSVLNTDVESCLFRFQDSNVPEPYCYGLDLICTQKQGWKWSSTECTQKSTL